MPTHAKASTEVTAFIDAMKTQFHDDLVKAEVTIGALACWPGEHDYSLFPALKHHGYHAAALIKKTSAKDRLAGLPDAVLIVDGRTWNTLDDKQKAALIDHELTHLQLVKDDQDEIVSDDAGRPKLRIRLHDWQLGGFDVIANRHGQAALEVREFHKARESFEQLRFNWTDDQAGQTAAEQQQAVSSVTITKDTFDQIVAAGKKKRGRKAKAQPVAAAVPAGDDVDELDDEDFDAEYGEDE